MSDFRYGSTAIKDFAKRPPFHNQFTVIKRKKMRIRTIFTISIGLLVSTLGCAEVTRLVCDLPMADSELPRLLAVQENGCKAGLSDFCSRAQETKRHIEECANSNLPFSKRLTLTYDPSTLSGNAKSFAEFQASSCAASDTTGIIKTEIESTPSFIVFKMGGRHSLSVNRETLKADYDNMTWSCHLGDVKPQKNKI